MAPSVVADLVGCSRGGANSSTDGMTSNDRVLTSLPSTSTGDYAKAIAEYVGATVLYWDVPTVCVLHNSNPTLSHLKMLLFIVRTPQNAVALPHERLHAASRNNL